MSTKIKGAEYPLSKIFSSEFDYVIPAYQRPYAWTEEETGTLFEDLYEFYQSEPADESYFLGSIVLIKEEDMPLSEVIDGQQRLTTLTMLLAVLTSRLSGDDWDDFRKYLIEPGRASLGIPTKPRLCLRTCIHNQGCWTGVGFCRQLRQIFSRNPDGFQEKLTKSNGKDTARRYSAVVNTAS